MSFSPSDYNSETNETASQSPYTLREIARECAAFAADNYDPGDSNGLNAMLTPENIWQGWHDKNDTEAPEMPAGFTALYLAEYLAECLIQAKPAHAVLSTHDADGVQVWPPHDATIPIPARCEVLVRTNPVTGDSAIRWSATGHIEGDGALYIPRGGSVVIGWAE